MFVAIFVALLSILVAQVALTPQPDLMPDLTGSIALVTGASRGNFDLLESVRVLDCS